MTSSEKRDTSIGSPYSKGADKFVDLTTGDTEVVINHKDENRWNNNVNNLEWCTASYNNNYNNGQKRRAITRKLNRR